MKSVVTVLALLGLAGGVGQDAPVDDWTFVESGPQGMIAMTEFAGGQAIIAQCHNGELKLLMTGMPATTRPARNVEGSRADGRRSHQSWMPTETPGVFKAATPARQARFLRGGGGYEIRSEDAETPAVRATFDLPAQSANLERVIAACDWPLQDDRDALAEPAPGAFDWARQGGRAPRRVRDHATLTAVIHQSCIIRNLRLVECRVDHALPAGGHQSRQAAQDMEGTRLVAADPSLVEGTVVYLTTTQERISIR